MGTGLIDKNTIISELDKIALEVRELKESDKDGDAGKDIRH